MIISDNAIEELKNYSWPGNVRELRNLMQRIAILSSSEEINQWELHQYWAPQKIDLPTNETISSNLPLDEARRIFEANYIHQTLSKCNGNITKTAQLLNLNRSYLYEKMKELGIRE